MNKIKVRVKQAHRKTRKSGKFDKYVVGQIVSIPESEFSPNLHEPIREVKNYDSRTKKR